MKHTASEEWQKRILEDLAALLERKGFGRFRGFEIRAAAVESLRTYRFDPATRIDWDAALQVEEKTHYEFKCCPS